MTPRKITVAAGHTFSFDLRWETAPIVRVPIKGITCPNGSALIETTVAHGVLDGWRCAIVNVQHPKQINASDPNKIKDEEYYPAAVVSPTVVELNKLNIADLKPYTSGGFLQFNTPVDLTGIALRFRMYDRKGGKLLASNLIADAPLNILVATTDVAARKSTMTFPSTATELLSGKAGWYDVEAASADATPVVTPLVYGEVVVEKE